MFTGLIEEVGTVSEARHVPGGVHLSIRARHSARQLRSHDSVAVNGVCLTVTGKRGDLFATEAVEETLRKTTLGGLRKGTKVNIELPMKLEGRLGGHLVQGHVDGVGTVRSTIEKKESRLITIEYPEEFRRYVVPVGSIAVDGVSLTVAELRKKLLVVSVIPYTMEHTTLGHAQPGVLVNLEFDLIGKYVERLLGNHGAAVDTEGISREKLRKWGYDV